MQTEDRPIHFSTELIHAPGKVHFPTLQKLYFALSQTRNAAYLNTEFSPQAPPRFHSRRGDQCQSLLVFLPDRMLITEEWVDIPFSDFLDKVRTVIEHASPILETGPYLVQAATIRTTFALTHHRDARAFLLDHVCGQKDRIVPFFGRPIGVGGLRFELPETPDFPGSLHVIIESFRRSQVEVYVEVKGIFANQRIEPDTADTALDNLRSVREFVSQNVYPYLAQFDLPAEMHG